MVCAVAFAGNQFSGLLFGKYSSKAIHYDEIIFILKIGIDGCSYKWLKNSGILRIGMGFHQCILAQPLVSRPVSLNYMLQICLLDEKSSAEHFNDYNS